MDKRLVIKSNFLVEASYKLSAIEQKIILSLSTKIKKEDQEFKKYTFNLGELSSFLGLNTNADYAYLQETTRALLSKVLILKKENSLLQTHWFESVEYFEKTGTVSMCFSPDLKPFMLQLKENFTKFQLKYAIQLKSRFSIRTYELLKQYESIGTREFLLTDLKEMLGVGPEDYPLYGNFKAKVLLVAQKELQAKTDIAFDFEEIKVGRSVGRIRFTIHSQEVPLVQETADTPIGKQDFMDEKLNQLVALLPQAYQDKQSIRKLLQEAVKKNDFDYVMRNIIYSNDRSNAMKPGSNPEKGSNYRVYLAKALRDDYGLAYLEDQQVKKEAEQVRQKTFAEAEKQKQRERNQIDQERENREKARVFISSYAPETLETYAEEARKRLSPDSLARYHRKDPIGLFEFKRRLEDVVMEHTGLRQPQPETASGLSENNHDDREASADAA